MTTFQVHYELAKHNAEVSKSLKSEFVGWSIVVLYYAAIHWVNGFLIKNYPSEFQPSGHKSRLDFVSRKVPALYKPLRQLEAESEKIRYEPPYWKNIDAKTAKNIENDYEKIKRDTNQ